MMSGRYATISPRVISEVFDADPGLRLQDDVLPPYPPETYHYSL